MKKYGIWMRFFEEIWGFGKRFFVGFKDVLTEIWGFKESFFKNVEILKKILVEV